MKNDDFPVPCQFTGGCFLLNARQIQIIITPTRFSLPSCRRLRDLPAASSSFAGLWTLRQFGNIWKNHQLHGVCKKTIQTTWKLRWSCHDLIFKLLTLNGNLAGKPVDFFVGAGGCSLFCCCFFSCCISNRSWNFIRGLNRSIPSKNWMGPYQRTPKKVARVIRYTGFSGSVRSCVLLEISWKYFITVPSAIRNQRWPHLTSETWIGNWFPTPLPATRKVVPAFPWANLRLSRFKASDVEISYEYMTHMKTPKRS